MKKVVFFAAVLMIIFMLPLSVSAAEPAMLFRFNENWDFYFNAPEFFQVQQNSGYDPGENALRIETDPYNSPHGPHYMLLVFIDEDYLKPKNDYEWVVVCMKRPTLSPSLAGNPNRDICIAAFMEDADGNANSSMFFATTAAKTDDEYRAYVIKFGNNEGSPAADNYKNQDVTLLRICPFGRPYVDAEDVEGGSTAYLRYIAVFDNEDDARAFAEAHPDGSDIEGIEVPTVPPTDAPEPTEAAPTAGGNNSDGNNTTAAPGNSSENQDGEDGELNIWLIVGIAAGAVVVIAAVVFIVIKGGKKKG